MSLHINSREHLKQRQEVKPLTMEEEDIAVDCMNDLIGLFKSKYGTRQVYEYRFKLMQSMLYNYENYKHFFIISQSKTTDMEVQYEIVESKMNDNG